MLTSAPVHLLNMNLVPSMASSCQVITVGFRFVPTAKPLCLFSRCSLATSASLWEKPGNASGFPHSTPGWVGSQGRSDHLALTLHHCWSSAQAPWWMRTPDLWATLWKADNILPSSQVSLHPCEVCRQCFDHPAAPFHSTCPRSSASGLHIRDSFKLQPHLLWFFSVLLLDSKSIITTVVNVFTICKRMI